MNTKDFNMLMSNTFNNLDGISRTKGIEYAGEVDRLANFRRLGLELDLDPEHVLWVYLTKHLDAIRSYLRAHVVLSEPIEGRIDDAILYLILLKGLIQERSGVPDFFRADSSQPPPVDSEPQRLREPVGPRSVFFGTRDERLDRDKMDPRANKGLSGPLQNY